MASTLDKLKKASVEPVYDYLNFSDFYPTKQGRIRYRVNLSKKMVEEVTAISRENDEIQAILDNAKATPEEKADAEARQKASNERSLAFAASLIMADDEKGDETLTVDEWKEWIAMERDEEDRKFTQWVQTEVIKRTGDYLQKGFLAPVRSNGK